MYSTLRVKQFNHSTSDLGVGTERLVRLLLVAGPVPSDTE